MAKKLLRKAGKLATKATRGTPIGTALKIGSNLLGGGGGGRRRRPSIERKMKQLVYAKLDGKIKKAKYGWMKSI